MELFTIAAKVTIHVFGIGGDFVQQVEYHVYANNLQHAMQKFEMKCKQDFAHMQYESIRFEYNKKIATIK